MINKSIIIVFFLVALIAMPASAQEEIPQDIIDRFLKSPTLKTSLVGFQLIDLDSGEQLAGHNQQKMFVPASTIKLLYTLGAVDQLGAEYRFETRLKINGEILPDGTLEGDLIVVPSGDPSLASNRFGEDKGLHRLLGAIKKLIDKEGINCIDGNIVIRSPFSFHPVSGKWLWEDIGNYYAGGSWPLNFNENEYRLEFQVPDKVGKPTTILRIDPSIPFLNIQNEVRSGPKLSGDQAYIFGDPWNYYRIVRGTLPAGSKTFSIKGSIPNPPYTFAMILKNYLEDYGIFTAGILTGHVNSGDERSLGVYRSPKLEILAKSCNVHSLNLYSEALGQAMLLRSGNERDKAYPDQKSWLELFEKYDLPSGQVQLDDACGLSKSNLITPNAMNHFLFVLAQNWDIQKILDLMPENGIDGTVKNFLKGKKYKNALWLKSGSVAGVLNYSGIYKSSKDDKYYAFTVFVNHSRSDSKGVKSAIQQFISGLIDHTGK